MDVQSVEEERRACLVLIEHKLTAALVEWGFHWPHISKVDQRGHELRLEITVGEGGNECRSIQLDAARLADPATCREQLRRAECQCHDLFAPIYLLIDHTGGEVEVSLVDL